MIPKPSKLSCERCQKVFFERISNLVEILKAMEIGLLILIQLGEEKFIVSI